MGMERRIVISLDRICYTSIRFKYLDLVFTMVGTRSIHTDDNDDWQLAVL